MLDKIMEVLVRALAWLIQIGTVMLVATVLTVVLVWGAETVIRKKRGKFLPRFLIVLLVVCVLLTVSAMKPMVLCEEDLTPEQEEIVQGNAAGLYSWSIPLVPICIRVNQITNQGPEYRMEYEIQYFCVGTYRMEYSSVDGYNAMSMSLFGT